MSLPLSVIIPTKNEEAYIGRLLESIKLQTAQPAEIIVADENSTDKTREIAKKYGCKIVQGGNHPGIGRNKGAKFARSPLLLFLDADIILPDKEFLQATTEELKKRNLGVACCLATVTSKNIVDQAGVRVSNAYFAWTEKKVKNGVGYCTFILKKIHDRIGGYNEEIILGEDQDYVVRASKIEEFGFLRSKKIVLSLRRHLKEGRVRLMLKYFYFYALLLLGKKATKENIHYSFDHKYVKK